MKQFVRFLGRVYNRNSAIFDIWSIVHLLMGILLALLIDPFFALAIMVLWEPFELLVLSPWIWKKYRIVFGYETIRNSLSDILFDTIGVTIGWILLKVLEVNPLILHIGPIE